jgi:hypothetical protein
MDAQVDSRLGDSITYIVDGAPLESAPGVPTIPGYIILVNADGSFAGTLERFNPHQHRWKCKVHKRFLPGLPDIRHRIEHSKLDATYRPAADTLDDDGDYYLFDLQKAG